MNVIPAPAGIYNPLIFLDSRRRGSDENRINQSFLNVPSMTQTPLYFRIKANSLYLFRTAVRLRGNQA